MTIPNVPQGADLSTLSRIVQQIADEVRRIDERTKPNVEGWAGNQSNVTADRAFDANSTSTDELADVLGTLIDDLVNIGLIK